jgi:hypothetical protein
MKGGVYMTVTVENTNRDRQRKVGFSEISDFRLESRLKPRHFMASASHIGRQSRPNLRDFESFSELSGDVGLWGKGHFFRSRSLYLGFYATFCVKMAVLGGFCASDECH